MYSIRLFAVLLSIAAARVFNVPFRDYLYYIALIRICQQQLAFPVFRLLDAPNASFRRLRSTMCKDSIFKVHTARAFRLCSRV